MPKVQHQRVHARRAASKEALKQMQILLDDQKDVEILSDDDDVVEVGVQPPKKKYKAAQRKSGDDHDGGKIVANISLDSLLDLQVFIEELSPIQKLRREEFSKEDAEIEGRINQLVKSTNTEVIYNGVYTTGLQVSQQLDNVVPCTPVQNQNIVLPATATATIPQNYQLLMDTRGYIVGAQLAAPPLALLPGKTAIVSQQSTTTPSLMTPTVESSSTIATTAATTTTTKSTRRNTSALRTVPSTQLKQANTAATQQQTKSVKGTIQVKSNLGKSVQKVATTAQKIGIAPLKGRPSTIEAQANLRPSEQTVFGGLSLGKSGKSVDLTGDANRTAADSREISFNKLQGRTFPSLVVVARPHLRVKDLASDRGKLDAKVKSVLMYPPTRFTEWLIQQGLLKSDQRCALHPSNQLKLGMYSDASKFPYSGGYVWISECCPQRFVSVFSGSLFESSPHPPMALLKLIYHWCCQTIVQNVTQWVKVDNLFVKSMYTWLRSICTVALHTHAHRLGGPGVKVQVGVISLGTTSQDGNQRQVKVEVLGVLESTTKYIRLRAVEPIVDGERNNKKRFSKILEPVFNWVHPSSTIVTDLTVDKQTLQNMGFLNVQQTTSTDYNSSNRAIMEYLRRIVPRMFQNTLSLLSRQIIQQFLDELVWREWYGTTVMHCFDNIILHLSEQTRVDSGLSLIARLHKVSTNPFRNWTLPSTATTTNKSKVNEQSTNKRYNRVKKSSVQQSSVSTPSPSTSSSAAAAAAASSTTSSSSLLQTNSDTNNKSNKSVVNQDVSRPNKANSPDVVEQLVPLENYYYGALPIVQPQIKAKTTINIKCTLCKATFVSNIALMNHLFRHAHNVTKDQHVCKYCLAIVPNEGDFVRHILTSHPEETRFNNSFACLICEQIFMNPFVLGKHMSKEHCPSELPYICGTCGYRCSNHKIAIDHFYQQHDYGTTIQCPFCLKSTAVHSAGRNLVQNINYFMQHLQKHQKKQIAKRCGRCNLWFVQKDSLKEHQTKMHISQRGKHGLVPAFAPRNGIMVPKSRMDKCPDDGKIINFSTLQLNINNKALLCKECNKQLASSKHFSSFESCQSCQYSTCCANTMQDHISKCKSLTHPTVSVAELPFEMFCICGYSDTDGNSLAKHLALCERKSAYPSSASAKQATVTHSMLDVLGLVRKPEEIVDKNDVSSLDFKPRRPRKQVLEETDVALEEVEVSNDKVVDLINNDDDDNNGGVCIKDEFEQTDSRLDEDVDKHKNDEKKVDVDKVVHDDSGKVVNDDGGKVIDDDDTSGKVVDDDGGKVVDADCGKVNEDDAKLNDDDDSKVNDTVTTEGVVEAKVDGDNSEDVNKTTAPESSDKEVCPMDTDG